MKANTAVAVSALAIAGWAQTRKRIGSGNPFLFRSSIGIALVVIGGTLIEDLGKVDLHLENWLVNDQEMIAGQLRSGRPSPLTLVCLSLLMFSMLARSDKHSWQPRASGLAILLATLLPLQSVVAALEGVTLQFGLEIYAQMATNTAIAILCVATGVLLSRPRSPVVLLLTGRSQGSRIARALLLAAVSLPPTLFLVSQTGQHLGLWSAGAAAILRMLVQIAVFSWIALRTGWAVVQAEEKTAVAYTELRGAVLARDEFLSIASHELRTPLTTIKLKTDLLDRAIARGDPSVFEPERVAKFIEQTGSGVERMARLVDDMLDVSRIETGRLRLRMQAQDLGDLVRATIEKLGDQLVAAKIAVRVQAEPNLIARLDPMRIEQVIANLVTNAIRYAPGARLRVAIASRTPVVRLEFTDSGPGIPSENLERVFERFVRLVSSNEVSGLGLGLFISRKIVEAHSGRLWAEMSPESGARFVMELPRA